MGAQEKKIKQTFDWKLETFSFSVLYYRLALK